MGAIENNFEGRSVHVDRTTFSPGQIKAKGMLRGQEIVYSVIKLDTEKSMAYVNYNGVVNISIPFDNLSFYIEQETEITDKDYIEYVIDNGTLRSGYMAWESRRQMGIKDSLSGELVTINKFRVFLINGKRYKGYMPGK